MDKEILSGFIKDNLNDKINNFNVQKMDCQPEYILLFIFIGKAEELNEYLQRIAFFEQSSVKNGYVHYLTFTDSKENETTLGEAFREKMNTVANAHVVNQATKIFMIPVFVQSPKINESEFSQLCESFHQQLSPIIAYFQNTSIQDVLWWTTVLLTNDAASSKKWFLNHVLQLNQKIDYGFVNHIFFLQDRDNSNLAVSKSTTMHTLLTTMLLLAESTNSGLCIRKAKEEEVKFFSAHAFNICMPIHIEIISRVLSLLKWFLEDPSEDYHVQHLKNFGKELGGIPIRSWWASTWKRLPRKDEAISIEPLRSFSFNGATNMTVNDIECEMDRFIKRYYLSMLPIDKFQINDEEFWNLYLTSYGCYLKALDDIFGQGKLENFLNECIPEISVVKSLTEQDSKMPYIGNDEVTQKIVYRKEEELAAKIRGRIQTLYKRIFDINKSFSKRVRIRYGEMKKITAFLTSKLQEELDYWRGDELDSESLLQENVEIPWKEEDRKKLLKAYFAIINTKSEEDFASIEVNDLEKFVKLFFDIATRTLTIDAKKFLFQLRESYFDTDRSKRFQLWKLYSEKRCNLLFPINTIESEWHFFFDTSDKFGNSLCEFVDAHNKHNRAVSDRIEILRISHPVEVKKIIGSDSVEEKELIASGLH